MKLFQQIERINRLHEMIKKRKTGKPEELAQRLHVSESRLYNIIDYLKLNGAPIKYSRQIDTYYYDFEYHINIQFEMGALNQN